MLSWLKESLATALSNIETLISNISGSVVNGFSKLGIDIVAVKDAVVDNVVSLKDKIVAHFLSLIDRVKDIFDRIVDLGKLLLELPSRFSEMLGELFKELFVPSPDYFDNRIDLLKEKFPIVEDVQKVGASLMSFFESLSSSTPPVVTLDLGSSGTKYSYGGGSVKVIDMSWFAPYKKTTDLIMSAFMWLTFAWRVFHRIPSVLNGAGGTSDAVKQIHDATK